MDTFWKIFLDQFRSTYTYGTSKGAENAGAAWMWILLALGLLGVLLAAERMYKLWMCFGAVNAEKFMVPVMKHVESGELNKAFDLCNKAQASALPYVIMRGIDAARMHEHPDWRTIQDGIDMAMIEIMPKLQARLSYINLIASVATLIGLAGTIFGLILAFDAVGQPGVNEATKSAMLAAGISAAMGTTIAGLFIAVPMQVVYSIINNKLAKILDDVDEWGVKFVNLIQRVK